VLHMPAFNTAPHGPAFTSVNGPSSVSPTEDQKPPIVAKSSTWSPASRGPETSYHSPRSDTSPSTVSSRDRSPESVNKRRRSASEEETILRRSPGELVAGSRQLPNPFQSVSRDTHTTTMDAPQQPSLPPLGRPDAERRWQTEPRELPHTGHQHFDQREPRPAESARPSVPSDTHARIGSAGETDPDDANTTEVTRAGVQVELKKRKRVSHSASRHCI
jgi:hypothetical protein